MEDTLVLTKIFFTTLKKERVLIIVLSLLGLGFDEWPIQWFLLLHIYC